MLAAAPMATGSSFPKDPGIPSRDVGPHAQARGGRGARAQGLGPLLRQAWARAAPTPRCRGRPWSLATCIPAQLCSLHSAPLSELLLCEEPASHRAPSPCVPVLWAQAWVGPAHQWGAAAGRARAGRGPALGADGGAGGLSATQDAASRQGWPAVSQRPCRARPCAHSPDGHRPGLLAWLRGGHSSGPMRGGV